MHRVFLSYTRDRWLKVSSERLDNGDKAPCPRALLPGRGSNRGPPVWKSEALTARPRQLLKCQQLKIIGTTLPFINKDGRSMHCGGRKQGDLNISMFLQLHVYSYKTYHRYALNCIFANLKSAKAPFCGSGNTPPPRQRPPPPLRSLRSLAVSHSQPFLKIGISELVVVLRGLTHRQKFVIWMIIPVKNNSNDEFLARVYAN